MQGEHAACERDKRSLPVFQKAVNKSEITGNTWGGMVNGVYIAVFLLPDGEVCATEGYCTHENCMLNFGYLEGDQIECGCHGARFSVRTGRVTYPPAITDLLTFDVEVRDEDIYVDV
jgi:nitrite reductase/ring-hydroxylating ferredoxin subunit